MMFDALQQLSSQMNLEPAEDLACSHLNARQQNAINVSHAMLPNGKQIRMLKTLLTSACELNCNYCPFRSGRDFKRATLKPDEMARAFVALHRAGIVQGMFLSSGVAGGSIRTQDKLIATAEIIRSKHHFDGYLHLKLMPGAEKDQVKRAMQLADRVSVNLEAPNTKRLERLAPRKAFLEELMQPLRWVDEIRRTEPAFLGWKGHWPSMVTQFVVGAVDESDLELLSTTAYLHNNLHLGRAYYSAFHPINDTPFETISPASPVREHRLYQASFLLRDYGFELEDLPFNEGGYLPEISDPKTIWAETHLLENPIEINLASRQELLRIPGFGPKSTHVIMTARRKGKLHSPEELFKLGVNPSRAMRFILIDGRRPSHQLSLF
jgi:predicted DNA-binding helix-hairpin-helix protein